MNKKLLLPILAFVIAWNLILFSFRDSERRDSYGTELEKSNVINENEPVQELLAVYNHETDKVMSIPLEEYVVCVLSAEMPVSFGIEALKAQAVAARTYTVYCITSEKESINDADVCTDYRHCQAFNSAEEISELFTDNQYELIRRAVKETEGEILTFEGNPINAVYHASSDGKTENAEAVWGNYVPYLVSVVSENESGMSGFESEVSVSREGFFEKLAMTGYNTANFASGKIYTCINESGRVSKLIVENKNGEKIEISGIDIRKIFSLRSCSFHISASDEKITFTVRGYGHGVGLSQYGAKVMAQNGKNYMDILLHYYSGCDIEKREILI